MTHRWSALLAVALVVGACSSPSPEDAAPTTVPPTTSRASPTGTPTTSPATPPASTEEDDDHGVPLDEVAVTWQEVGSGFEGPLQVLTDPRDGSTLVVEQVGRVRTLDGDTVLDLTDRVTTAGNEQGLLGVAFHPDADRLFVHYSGQDGGRTVLASFPAGGELSAADETVLLTEPQPARNHNGGALLFDPDGALILALGDGGGGGDQFGNGQDTDTRKGGLLRLDVDREPGEALPHPDNPFLDGGAPELWAYGLRNPWRVDFDTEEDWLYIADVGQDAVEEVDVVRRDDVGGANFGWPRLEGAECFRDPDCSAAGTVLPVEQLRHGNGACSIIGGVVVPEASPTELAHAFLYSDLCDTRLRAVRVDEHVHTSVIAGGELPAAPLGFGRGADGQVWVGTTDGRVLELRPG